MSIQTSSLPNMYSPAVLARLREIETTTQSGVGLMLPPGNMIGRCLQKFVDDATQAQLDTGLIRINPLGEVGTIISRYI